jgi:serine/threonine protein kinase
MDNSGAKVGSPREDSRGTGEVSSVESRLRASDMEDAAPRAIAGKRIGRYRLLFPIASGGMAQVWAGKAEGGGLARTVAIKLVRPEYAADDEYSRMFIDEAMIASSIHHPNVCEIYELGRDGDLLFMVLEWIAGDSLSGLVQKGNDLRPLPDDVAARITADACAGLHAAHEALGQDGQPLGIVHRDVSPPNILVSMHGHVKVSDFGIAKARDQLHSRTRTGEIKGKFAYIPPEQILGKGVDRRADVYAMGCVLYVASLGLRPFGSGAGALGKIVRGKYRLPHELRADYPPGLEAIIVKALAADPTKRYQTADEMRLAIEQWVLTEGRVVVSGDVSRIVRERMSPDRKRLVDAIQSAGRAIPEAIAQQLLSLSVQTKEETPTANSGLIVPPPGLRKPSLTPGRSSTPGSAVMMRKTSESDSTQLDPGRDSVTVRPKDASSPRASSPGTVSPATVKPAASSPKPAALDLAAKPKKVAPMTPVANVPLTLPDPERPPEAELTNWVGPLRSNNRYWLPAAIAAAVAIAASLYRLYGG